MRSAIAISCLVFGGLLGLLTGPFLQGQAHVPLAVPKEMTSYRDVVKQVLPAVVSIEAKVKSVAATKRLSGRQPLSPDDLKLPEEFRKFFGQPKDLPFQLPEAGPQHSFGSGVVVDPNGVILTNQHVVAGAEEVEITFHDGSKLVSRDIKTDPKTDLAVVRVAKSSLPYLELGDSEAMEIGDRVLAVGAPFGLTGSVTAGIISGKGRNMHMNLYEDFLQTDAAINPGNSGGPLVNLEGKLIGINTMIKSHSGGSQGVGFAIASNLAKTIKDQLLQAGVVHRGYLGIQISALQPEVAARLGLEKKMGVLVSRVMDNTPAAKGGIEAGDVITAIAGKPLKDAGQLQQLVAALPLNKAVEVTVFRDGKPKTLQVMITEQPTEFGLAKNQPSENNTPRSEGINLSKFGIKITDLTQQLADQFGFKEKQAGALVTEVEDGSLAATAGLARGMLIVKVDHQPVSSAEAVQKALEKTALDKGVLFQVMAPNSGVSYILLQATTTK